MTSPRIYWQGQQFVAEWLLRDVAGDPVDDATVTGEVTRPDGSTASMTVANAGSGIYRAAHVADAPGTHTFALSADGTAQDAVQGRFVVARTLMGLPPITLDPTDDIGMIRLLITDVNEAEPLFEDAQLDALLTREGGVKRAAAAALEIIARSEVLISKVLSTQDLTTNGAAVAAELRASARTLREQADRDADDAFGLDVIDFDPNAAYRYGRW
ncbi:hypothetical protein ACFYUR_18745 [Micromonospora haikouensis]|uniref:hypothetical protein n=1 Tax=Micromonospora haikouensis TaxID=686309 RepID=UPI00369323BB